MVTENTIEQYLQDLNIPYERLDDRLWRTGFRGDVKDIDVQIRLADSVLIVISPFINAPRKNRAGIYKRLLELNMDIMLTKFVIDSEGDVYLMTEVLAETLGVEQFEQAVMNVTSLHDKYYGQIVALMYSPLEEDTEGDDLELED
ncbi:MAG TPA: YbjN domain-containing protein [Armatimonadota bacterium]|jgi:hypothetical protein|nr:YbjN domain-containing protein [Armatimonadota bacterium]HOM80403.1 YbjN domain-containing protein [Armatimonadota bacterium]HOQ28053.1 YbjN domain-containing protein [Armatimonadota bacterium]HPO74196.1 YbjN domain-containing protein [Armatimonadota bacterium]HPT98457.1 YbjN domain-containing protein [Armatimonadota bacterium]